MKFVGADVTNGLETSVEYVVDAFEAAGLLNSYQAMRFFNNADYRMVARSRSADAARLNVREVVTDRAKNDAFFYFMYGRDQTLELVVRRAHDVKRQPLRRLVSDAGQAFQFVDQFCDGFGVFKHGKFRVSSSEFRVNSG